MKNLSCILMATLLSVSATVSWSHAAGQDLLTNRPDTSLSIAAKGEHFTGSRTSYEFGNPFPPNQSPLSRLEFPLNTWWGGIEIRFNKGRFSAGGEVLTNTPGDVTGVMKDSDWDDESAPERLSIYSESRCRMKHSYRTGFDAGIDTAGWMGMPRRFSLHPLAGFRYQVFNLVAHDGTQVEFNDYSEPLPLPGDGILFKQQFWHYFAGFRAQMDTADLSGLPRLLLSFQLDWAFVNGSNKDRHLLRAGERYTYERTAGRAWNGSISLKRNIGKGFSLEFHAGYLTVKTTGTHRIVNKIYDIDFQFSRGVRVWSEQTSLGFAAAYTF